MIGLGVNKMLIGVASNGLGVASNGLLNGLIGAWEFNEISGSVAYDSHGDNNGSNYYIAEGYEGKIDKCYSFNGNSSKVILPEFSYSSDFSISVWIYSKTTAAATEYRYILGTEDAYNNNQLTLRIYPRVDQVELMMKDSSGNRVYAKFADGTYNSEIANEWHHLTASFNATTKTLYAYLDGILVDIQSNSSFNGININYNTVVGFVDHDTSYYNKHFDGEIDALYIWDKVLLQEDIEILHNSGNGLPYSQFTS